MVKEKLTADGGADYQADVLVVGGGVLGIVAARGVVANRKSCALVFSVSKCSGESGHAQGLIHKGYSYLELDNLGFSNELRDAAVLWEGLLPSEVQEASTPVYYFRQKYLLHEFEKAVKLRGGVWKVLGGFSGLPYGMGTNLDAQEWFAFESPEYVVRPARLWETVANGLKPVESIEGEWKQATSDGVGLLSVVETDGGEVTIRSKSILLATGYEHLRRISVTRQGITQDVKTLSAEGARVYMHVVSCKSKAGFKKLEVLNCDVEDFRAVEIGGHMRNVRFNILSQVDDGEVIWRITSNLLTSRQPDLGDAEERWRLLGECLETFLFGFSRDQIEVNYCRASFALPPEGDRQLSERCVATASLGAKSSLVYAAYGERLTLAARLGELLGQQNLAGSYRRLDREPDGMVIAPKFARDRAAAVAWGAYGDWAASGGMPGESGSGRVN